MEHAERWDTSNAGQEVPVTQAGAFDYPPVFWG